MPARVGYVGTQNPGDVLTSGNFDKLGGGVLGYAVKTADQTGIGTVTDITSLSIAVDFTTLGTRLVRLSAKVGVQVDYSGAVGPSAPAGALLSIKEGATILGGCARTYFPTSGDADDDPRMDMTTFAIVSPTAASHTYKLTMEQVDPDGNITVSVKADANYPSWIVVEDVGPAF